jgi:anaerobic ribonucleoside-triphosphate reductase
VVAFRIGRKLKRFVNLNCCLRCGYDLRERVEDGCPECGWMRTGQPVVGCS